MAVLIPRDLANSQDTHPNDVRVGEALTRTLPEDVWVWYNSSRRATKPRFVMISPNHGILGVEVYDWSPIDVEDVTPTAVRTAGGHIIDPIAEMGRRLEALRQEIRGHCLEPPIGGLFVLPNFRENDLDVSDLWQYFPPGVVISGDSLSDGGWIENFRRLLQPLELDTIKVIRGHLYPETQFQRPTLLEDPELGKHLALRLQLDAEQESLARSLSTGVTLLSGVSGSGKSLVLCARARFLATEHPDWVIQMLCFNRSLVGYLHKLIEDKRGQVQIDTFYGWAHRLGIRLPSLGSRGSERRLQDAIKQAIARRVAEDTCDAILVDEGQDFAGSWLMFAYRALKPGRGGMVIATDMAQCIYREEAIIPVVFPPSKVTRVELRRNYRNTEQIGQFAIGTVFGAKPAISGNDAIPSDSRFPTVPEFALKGQFVRMVWAERWDDQALFIARQIRKLVEDRRATYGEIAVLYTQRTGMVGRILSSLGANAIPYFWVNRNRETKSLLGLNDSSVRVISVHSSKGLEFPIVFLFGVEALRVPQSLQEASEEEANRTRLAYVGMTRAQDLLYLTYTRTNSIVERALHMKDCCNFRTYPEDFDFN